MQHANGVDAVANNLFLGFWTAQSVRGFTQGDYMGTYAALGIASGIFSFALSLTIRSVDGMMSSAHECVAEVYRLQHGELDGGLANVQGGLDCGAPFARLVL